MQSRQTALVLAVLGAVLVMGIAPAGASTLASYGELVPAGPVYAIQTLETITIKSCPDRDTDARVTDAYPIQWPEVAAAQGVDAATSTLLINLDSRGNLVSARIANSSGNPLFDEEALFGARMSKYAPEVRNCNAFARAYYVDVMFE